MIEFEDTSDYEVSPLEYVIQLGVQGNHVLFDIDRIREAFAKESPETPRLGSGMMGQVREAVNEVLSIPDFEGKKEFISTLPQEIQDVLIHLYFQMVEKTMLISQARLH